MARHWVRSDIRSFNATSISPASCRYGVLATTMAPTAPWSTQRDGTLVLRVTPTFKWEVWLMYTMWGCK